MGSIAQATLEPARSRVAVGERCRRLLRSALSMASDEANYDVDDLPEEIDTAASEHSPFVRLTPARAAKVSTFRRAPASTETCTSSSGTRTEAGGAAQRDRVYVELGTKRAPEAR